MGVPGNENSLSVWKEEWMFGRGNREKGQQRARLWFVSMAYKQPHQEELAEALNLATGTRDPSESGFLLQRL